MATCAPQRGLRTDQLGRTVTHRRPGWLGSGQSDDFFSKDVRARWIRSDYLPALNLKSLLDEYLVAEMRRDTYDALLDRRKTGVGPVQELGGDRYFVSVDWESGSFLIQNDIAESREGKQHVSEEQFSSRCAEHFRSDRGGY